MSMTKFILLGEIKMQKEIEKSIKKRNEVSRNYYYRSIGELLKQKRLEFKMSQQEMSSKICSDTYLCKVETHQLVPNMEQLNLLMERALIPAGEISFPEEQMDYLEKSVNLFFWKDVHEYKKLFDDIDKYQFSALLQVVKLGYYILEKDKENARLVYVELHKYLNSLEDIGFSIFMMYGCFYNIMIENFSTSKCILDQIDRIIIKDELSYSLVNLAKFITYGNLELGFSTIEPSNIALNVFVKNSNIKRIVEHNYWRQIFLIYDGVGEQDYFEQSIAPYLDDDEYNYYYLLASMEQDKPIEYIDKIRNNGRFYLLGLFYKAKFYLENSEIDNYKEVFSLIESLHYEMKSKIDYCHILKLIKKNEGMLIKDYYINYLLPEAENIQNLYLIKRILYKISDILDSRNRYKDALVYRVKYDVIKKSLQA